MKFLLTAINAKYIHSNPGVYSLKIFAESQGAAAAQGDQNLFEDGLPCVPEKAALTAPAVAGLTEVAKEKQGAGCSMQVEIAEYTINNQMELILEDIYRRKPDLIGISCYIWNISYALDLVRDIHKVLPDADIWLGGPEVSYDAPELLTREPEVFGVMKGEGEEMFAGLLNCYRTLGCTVRSLWQNKDSDIQAYGIPAMERENKAGDFWQQMQKVAGLTYRREDGTVCDQPIRPVMDMSRIPFLYPSLDGFENRIVYYESSRGCPFSCSYCLSSIDKSVRFRNVKLVLQELDFFLERKVPQVKFVDRTFNAKKSHAMAIWKHILEHDNGVTNFHFEITADLLDEEELELISRMRPGLIQLEIGVQSNMGPEIRLQRLFQDRFVGAVRQGHPLASLSSVSLEDYVAWGHVVASPDGSLHGFVDEALAERGMKRKIASVVPGFPTALSVAMVSDLVAMVPALYLLNQPMTERVHVFELPFKTRSITVSQMWHPRMEKDPAHRWLREKVLEVCRAVR